jgi:hypothetical protein
VEELIRINLDEDVHETESKIIVIDLNNEIPINEKEEASEISNLTDLINNVWEDN